jgi:DNA-binding winged helix-turn-helix (wHTH) protein/tetratricopeptide (TPR) repeat protein
LPIHVHDFELDPVRFELRRGGEPVRVEPRVLEVLLYLAAHPDRVVSKQELLEQVWESRFVSESTLTRCIAEARRALGGGDPRQSPIQTVHGRGFRFVLPEEEVLCEQPAASPDHPSQPGPDLPPALLPLDRPSRRVGLAVALILILSLAGAGAWARWQAGPGTSALALLPIEADPRDRELALVALSLDDLFGHGLGAVPGLEVRRPSGRLGPGLPSRETPRALGGRLRRSGATGRVRLEVELIERVESGGRDDRNQGDGVRRTALGRFDVPFVDGSADLAVFVRVRDTVARRVLARLLPAIDLAPEPGLAPRDPEAYRLYLLALLDLREAGCVGDAAIGLLERSLERDPRFAPAWEELGWARYNLVSSCGESGENYALAAAAAGRALALAPGWTRAAALEAVVLTETGRPEQAWRRLARARERAPNNLDLRFAEAYVLTYAGLLDQAAARIEQVAAADPTYLAVEGWTPNALLHRGRPGDPERFLELLPGAESPLFLFYRGYAEALRGREAAARAVLAPVFRRQPGDLFARLAQAQLAILEGDRGQALLHLRQLALQRHAVGGSDGEVTYKLAQLLALAGSPDEAFGQLRLALAQGFFCPTCLRNDPAWEALRGEPRFRTLARAARTRQAAFVESAGLSGIGTRQHVPRTSERSAGQVAVKPADPREIPADPS